MEVPVELEKEIDQRITHYPVSKRSAVLPVLHLLQHHFRQKPMIKTQFAFMRGRSTESALSRVVSQIERAIYRGRQAVGVFLDIKGAFDNVKHEATIRPLE